LTELIRRSKVPSVMRRLIVIFLIALLPLRSWAVDVMGVSMAVQQLSAQAAPAGSGDSTRIAVFAGAVASPDQAAMASDCPILTMANGKSGAGDFGAGNSSAGDAQAAVSLLCYGCTTCQLCMAVFSGPSTVFAASEALRHSRPVKGDFGFASASLRGWLKPPIG
jgi:hypothetical protein